MTAQSGAELLPPGEATSSATTPRDETGLLPKGQAEEEHEEVDLPGARGCPGKSCFLLLRDGSVKRNGVLGHGVYGPVVVCSVMPRDAASEGAAGGMKDMRTPVLPCVTKLPC